ALGEQEEYRAVVERFFGTPQQARLDALCAGYGVAHRRAAGVAELEQALAGPVRGRSAVEVVVDRRGLRELHPRLRDAVPRAAGPRPPLREEPGPVAGAAGAGRGRWASRARRGPARAGRRAPPPGARPPRARAGGAPRG